MAVNQAQNWERQIVDQALHPQAAVLGAQFGRVFCLFAVMLYALSWVLQIYFVQNPHIKLLLKDKYMSKLMPVVALVVVAGLAFFGLKSAGVIGGPAELTDEQVSERLAGYADKINAEDGLSFDDWSKLSSATHIEKTITIRGETIMDAEKLAPDYFDSRRPQIVNILCHDEALRPTLSHATYNFNWFSADNKPLGDMITIRGDDTCAGSDPS